MSPEPLELQILRQTLGHDLGSMVHALGVLAGHAATSGQQLAEQAQQIEQMRGDTDAPASPEADPPSENPWTGPADPPKEGS